MTESRDRLTTITLAKEYLKFSIAHFTIFSATERERLHGHNYTVVAEVDTVVGDNGLAFNYRSYKDKLKSCCEALDEYLLLPEHSPHLKITTEGSDYHVTFNKEILRFPQADTLLIPIRNITVEELSHYILGKLTDDTSNIHRLVVRVSSGPGQSGSSEWVDH